jgi:hypothetical protein
MTKKLETCGSCEEFICKKIANWDSADSFVTHRTCISNLRTIREDGFPAFIKQQGKRLQLLEELLKEFDDGRSKGFYCLSTALLPAEELKVAMRKNRSYVQDGSDKKRKAKSLREAFVEIANRNHIELSYRRKT